MTNATLVMGATVIQLAPGQSALLGRGRECTIVTRNDRASRRHAGITWEGRWILTDLQSTNGTFVNGVRVQQPRPITNGDMITLGAPDNGSGSAVRFVQQPTGPALPDRPPRVIGRGKDCEVVVPDLSVSRHHAQLLQEHGQVTIADLGSSNGTFVNGVLVASALLAPGDIVAVGSFNFTLSRTGTLHLVSNGSPAALTASSVSYALPDGRTLLDDISFSLPPSSLTAVIGPSGAGKSTLFRAITGHLTPGAGSVVYQGVDLHQHFASLRHQIGVVPQDDVIHRALTVRQALTYAAELRFPTDVDRATREHRLHATIHELGLVQHVDTPVARLSGGQRKRTSVAMELLTQPSLLLLDEPTSGLDPGLDKSVMNTLRGLATSGRTVVVITHSVDNLDTCDSVVVLAPGGRLAYSGPPTLLLEYFDADRHSDVFDRLTAGTHRRAQKPVNPAPPPTRTHAPPLHVSQTGRPPANPQPRERGHQLFTLLRRQTRLLLADRSHALFNLALPLVLAALALAVPGEAGLGGPVGERTNEAMQLLVVLVVGAIFTGMTATIRDLVQERAIYERERDVGLSPSAYLLSKLMVYGTLTAAQATVMTAIVLAFKPGPQDGALLPWGGLELVLIVAMTAVVACASGLFASSMVSSSEQVMPILVIAVMAQLVLSGGIFPIAGRPLLAQLSWLAPSRWGYAGAASSVDVDAVSMAPSGDSLWSHGPGHLLLAAVMLGLQGLLFTLATRWRLEDSRSRPGFRSLGRSS